jgi:hypothetical protein
MLSPCSGGTCSPCSPGYAKGSTGPAACGICSAGQWSASGAAACSNCHANSNRSEALSRSRRNLTCVRVVSVAGSSQAGCICNAGYTGPDGSWLNHHPVIANLVCALQVSVVRRATPATSRLRPGLPPARCVLPANTSGPLLRPSASIGIVLLLRVHACSPYGCLTCSQAGNYGTGGNTAAVCTGWCSLGYW